MITVLRAGPLTTVQDLGRPGFAHLGVPRSGALDQPALRRANALVGNDPSAAALETTLMGCRLRLDAPATIAVTGATCTVKIDGRPVVGPVDVPAGAVVEIGRAVAGVRSYVAVAGGIDVEPVLGSRSTDTLSGLGPPRLTDGQTLAVGGRVSTGPSDVAGPGVVERPGIVLGVWVGPRDEWVEVAGLFEDAYAVSPVSNRVACRLAGTALSRTRAGELPPEGLVLGGIQVPPDGQPLIFLADHPTTGGYPVVGVVDDVTPLAQARPGTSVRFRELH
ncbi:biotin-dependent carboxyltransferase family protein [Actinoplanes sp. NPDC051343]|uniref:biotin-dependent carboxyltransferase family protein n=1 Tax=Actinoplanes sp. NPDC051343 TaxID=3363906 RepID=UPI003797138E